MNQRLRIGLIGAGGIVKSRHLPNLVRLAEVELVAVSNRRPESAEAIAREWGVGRIETDWRAVVAADDIDAVLIGTPPVLHKEIAIAALEAGKHVFCQARMARTYAEATAMLAAERRAALRGQKAQLCLAPDGLAVDAVMRQLLYEEQVLGRLLGGVVTAASGAYLDPAVPVHWRQSWAVSGYNTLSLGIIVEVVHRWLGEFRRVSALTATHTAHRPAPNGEGLLPVERPDLVAISALHNSGAAFSLHFSGVSRGAKGGIELHGTDASLRFYWGESVVWINR
ncbi:MAG TPA: Gfo/Idh/MocA family oxidoreductase, partial [Limnochordia bacterium]|nr:Gfo/Idh/MocA family oxidoreductase [Limnochordia bacterium]